MDSRQRIFFRTILLNVDENPCPFFVEASVTDGYPVFFQCFGGRCTRRKEQETYAAEAAWDEIAFQSELVVSGRVLLPKACLRLRAPNFTYCALQVS